LFTSTMEHRQRPCAPPRLFHVEDLAAAGAFIWKARRTQKEKKAIPVSL